ncbi:unnamed protein product [[Actinomadura] parvosata subsp. kistnae]|uniref:hypothetical protein n=1 Tax=[Actinomadura] parvosata TaxID=1955412 RepID=UPI000D28B16A|nr:unnamed protein product [Actinomadura parvosata subsp. kistnae]
MAVEEYLITAAARLLEQWLPAGPWRFEVVRGSVPGTEWDPALAWEHARFPRTGRRFPVAVESLKFDENPGFHAGQRAASGRPDAAAAHVIALLREVIERDCGPLPAHLRSLIAFLAGVLTEWDCEDLLRLHMAAEPGGPPLDGELHLFVRDLDGETCRLSLTPDAPRPAALDARIEWLTTLLGEFLWVGRDKPVDFTVTVVAHGLDLGSDAEAALRAWRRFADDDLRPMDGAALARVVADTERAAADLALAVFEGDAESGVGHLVAVLLRDLFDTIADRIGGGLRASLPAFGTGWPLKFAGEGARLVLVGPRLTAVITVDDRH